MGKILLYPNIREVRVRVVQNRNTDGTIKEIKTKE
jgi:hypothetical protein